MTTAEDNMVDFTFEDGSTVLADGQIATATVALKEKHQANPPVAVEIMAPGFNCARQRFEFSAEDPDSFEQSVTCRTDSGSAPTKDSKQIDVAALFTYFVTHPDPKKLNGVIKKLCKKFLLQRLVRDIR
ncbi:hypothetical protein Poli38472_013760 [Pythium oligandrum]|uniref:Uncharacterized protein n=1 Tax=Pythium oligandrum TaxID=41045 RepID=A0A8K1CDJ4_PYTOL|nr:hypothetical protein Poli38472_013760 [Pythium oligandrum]|eukprot:TMW61297.1 hypothetical protein Poli38472_013760 [Pythium oligandrum]